MAQGWDDYSRAAEKGPLSLGLKIVFLIFALGIVASVVDYGIGWFGETAKVAQKEFGPEMLLKKYEWFKDASSQLDKKQADIMVYDGRMNQMDETYKGLERHKWPREDREQHNLWSSEVAGVKASYNSLAADYNAQMAKFNWHFTNVGDLPPGADKPLPREYKPYMAQ